jgi:hypothetical protein
VTLDEFEAQFWCAVTETREGRNSHAVRRIRDAAEEYAAGRAGQIVDEIVRTATRRTRQRAAAS